MPADLPLIGKVRRTSAEHGLFLPGERVLVAVSGGPDSLALLHVLCTLREELGLELQAGYLDHRMRGVEGAADAAFVAETARGWGVPVVVQARDVPALARRTGLTLEEAGRAARYRFLCRVARRTGCAAVATAHTADDQVETVLLNLLRGTGLDGLAGIPASRPLTPGHPLPVVIRPLIDVSRAEVLDYCVTHALQPRSDPTNDSAAFLRNRIRHDLLPLLEARYSPHLRRLLLRLARLAEEETSLLDSLARELLEQATLERDRRGKEATRSGGLRGGAPPEGWSSAFWPRSGGLRGAGAAPKGWSGRGSGPGGDTDRGSKRIHLSRAVLSAAPPALARRAVRLAVQAVCPGPPPELAVVERLMSLVRGERPGFLLPGGDIAARVTAIDLLLEPAATVPPFLADDPVPLAIPGTTLLPWTTGAITASVSGVRCSASGDGESGSEVRTPKTQHPTPDTQHPTPDPREALLDRGKLVEPLTVRPPHPGDRIQPLGMAGHRKLQDLLTDRKVPRGLRRRLPVVCDAERIVWVAGQCVSEAVKITPETSEAVRLVWEMDGATGSR